MRNRIQYSAGIYDTSEGARSVPLLEKEASNSQLRYVGPMRVFQQGSIVRAMVALMKGQQALGFSEGRSAQEDASETKAPRGISMG